MNEQDSPLDREKFDMAATRPPMMLGLPHTLCVTLLLLGTLFVAFFNTGNMKNDLIADAIFLGGVAIVGSTAKILLQSDYHGWGNFCAWLDLDARFLDTRAWGGAHLSSFPLHSIYSVEYHGAD